MVGITSIDPRDKSVWTSLSATHGSTTSVYVFYNGSGVEVGRLSLTFTDSTKANISSVVKG